jgi:hypothetical protein
MGLHHRRHRGLSQRRQAKYRDWHSTGHLRTRQGVRQDQHITDGHAAPLQAQRHRANHHPPDAGKECGRTITPIRFAIYAHHDSIETWASVIGTTPSAKWVQNITREAKIIEVTSPRNALDLALAGTARAVLPTFIGSEINELKQVSALIDELEHEQWLVTHHEDRFVPEVRRVIDRTYAVLKEIT